MPEAGLHGNYGKKMVSIFKITGFKVRMNFQNSDPSSGSCGYPVGYSPGQPGMGIPWDSN